MSARTDKADKAVYGQGLVLGKRKAALKTALAFTAAVLVSSILSSSVTAAVVLSITTAGQTPVLAKILEKASYAPRDRINNYQNFFSMSPNDLSNMDSLTFIAPFDYECQSRAPYGPQPCPQGVPSRCRYYLFNDVSDICAYAYCKATKSTDPDFQVCWQSTRSFGSSSDSSLGSSHGILTPVTPGISLFPPLLLASPPSTTSPPHPSSPHPLLLVQ